jgi:hypothetical protein
LVVVIALLPLAAGLAAAGLVPVAGLAAGDAPGDVCVVVVVVVVVEELLCFPPEHATKAAAAIAAVTMTVTDFCMPWFLSRKP